MISPPPDTYEGTVEDYVGTHVAANFPRAAVLAEWMAAVREHHTSADPIFIVRGPRKGELARRMGLRVAHGDNSPGIWCLTRALKGDFDAQTLGDAIEGGRVPVLAALKGKAKRDWEWNYSPQALSRRDSGPIWDVHLKHCHILPVKRADDVSVRMRAMRNLCPANHFLFPNGWGRWHFVTERVGWSEAAPDDLGESPRVIAWVRVLLRDHLADHQREYDRFLRLIGSRPLNRQPPSGRIRIERVSTIRRSESHTSRATNTGRSIHPPGIERSVERTWTLNARHGYYVKTGESARHLVLNLRYRGPGGEVEAVGRYALDLHPLAEEGVVTRRGEGYDVKVVRDGGVYFLGVRAHPRRRLDDFSMP